MYYTAGSACVYQGIALVWCEGSDGWDVLLVYIANLSAGMGAHCFAAQRVVFVAHLIIRGVLVGYGEPHVWKVLASSVA